MHMCFSYKVAYVFWVDVGQVKSIRSLLTGSKSNIWNISSGVAIRQVSACAGRILTRRIFLDG